MWLDAVSSVRFRPVPSGSVRFRPVPSGSVRFRPVPSGSVRFRPVPSGRHVTRRLSVVEADGAAAERPDGEDGMERKMVRVARANVGDHLLFCVVMTLRAGVYDAAPWCTIARTSSGGWGARIIDFDKYWTSVSSIRLCWILWDFSAGCFGSGCPSNENGRRSGRVQTRRFT